MGIVGVGATGGTGVAFGSGAVSPAAVAAGPGGIVDVTRFGAVGDGKTLSTEGLQRAIDACAEGGGGLVLVPPGRYLTGALFLRSRIQLHIGAGAVLLGSPRPEDYPPVPGRDEGIERQVHAPLIGGHDLEDVAITGQGTIDHQGESWWKADEQTRKLRVDAHLPREAEHPAGAALRWPRPRVIGLIRCRRVDVQDLTLVDGACWNVHLVYCEDVVVDGLTMFQHRQARGTDGVVVDSSRRVRIANCAIRSGSDCIAFKSGYNADGRRVGLPCEDVVVTNCHLGPSSASGIAIGSETTGGIRDIVISNCVLRDCLSGMHVRSPRGRGGVVERVRVTDVVIDGVEEMAIKMSHYFDSLRMEGRYALSPTVGRRNLETARSRQAPVDEGTPHFRDFAFDGLMLGRVRDVAVLEGLPERYIRGVSFENVTATSVSAGIYASMVAELAIGNFHVGALDTPAVDARDVEQLEVHRLRCLRPPKNAPAFWLENVAGAFIHGCMLSDDHAAASWLHQSQCRSVTLANNRSPSER